MTKRSRRQLIFSPRVQFRSFRLTKNGGIVLPQKSEWQSFYHSPYGIPVLLLLLLVNFSYIDVLAAPPPSKGTTYNEVFVMRNDPSRSEREYRRQLAALLTTYLSDRGEYLRTRQEGTDTQDAQEAWLEQIIRTREQLLAMTVPVSMKETHLGAVYVTGHDEEAMRAALAQGLTPESAQHMQMAREAMELFSRAYPWVTAR